MTMWKSSIFANWRAKDLVQRDRDSGGTATSMLAACANSGSILATLWGACPGVCRALRACFLRGRGFSEGLIRCAWEGGAWTQFASAASAGCITCEAWSLASVDVPA